MLTEDHAMYIMASIYILILSNVHFMNESYFFLW